MAVKKQTYKPRKGAFTLNEKKAFKPYGDDKKSTKGKKK